MKAHRLTRTQLLPISIIEAWNFFSSPMNLADITPDWLGFKVMSEPPAKMYEGLIIQYNVTPMLGLPVWWVTEITHVREPFFFVDEQRKGPYAMWHHEHHFEETADGVLMTDMVHYILPLSTITQPVLGGYVAKKLNEIFDHRYRTLETRFKTL